MPHTPENLTPPNNEIYKEGTSARALYEENIINPLPAMEAKKTCDPLLAERLRKLGIPVILVKR